MELNENVVFAALFVFISNGTEIMKFCWSGEAGYFLL